MKNLVKTMFMNILTAGIFTFAFTACSDEIDNMSDNQQAPEGADTALLEAYGLTFENFIADNDVIILNADTTQLSISKAYADKMGITSFVNHPMGIWHKVENLPYIRKATAEKLVGDRFIVDVVPATVAEIMGDKKMNLQTDIYVNNDVGAVKTRAAGDNIPEYSAKYIDDNDVIHPAYIHLTDPYGYDTDYNTEDDQPSAAQTRAAASGEYQYISADEIADGQTRWGCHNRIISFENELEKKFNFAVGKGSSDSVWIAFKSKLEFGLNYFITLDGGVRWNWIIPDPYLKKFEAGLDGNFGFHAEVGMGFTKEWELDKDKFRKKLFTFKGYTFTFWIGPVPVAIVTDPHLDIALDAKVAGSLETSLTYDYANTFKAGFGWADGQGFYPITSFSEDEDELYFNPPQLKFHAEAGVGLYLVCDLKIYGMAGPELGVGPRLGAELEGKCSIAEEEVSFKAKVGLSVNAVIGAKLEVLGYELAEQQLTFALLDEVPIWAFNWDLKEELHKSPKAQKKEKELNNYNERLKAALEDSIFFEDYERTMTALMDLNSCDRQKAEEDIFNNVKTIVTNLETSTDKKGLENAIKNTIRQYYQNQLKTKHTAYLIDKCWKEVAEQLKECPAYIENARHWRTYKMDINMDFLHRYFVELNKREPTNSKEDLEKLAYYVLTYSKVVYVYNEGYRTKFTGAIDGLMKYGKTLGNYTDVQIEMAAYETLLEANMKRPASSFANLPWSKDFEHPGIQYLIDEYEWQLRRVKV